MGVGGVVGTTLGTSKCSWSWSSRFFVTSNMEAIQFPFVDFGFIQSQPNTSIREGKFKIPLLEELNDSREHRRNFVLGFHLLPFVIDG
jgi:hypothetical protein